MMNLAVVGVAGVALLTSVLSLNAGSPPAKQPETKRPPAEVATAFSPRSPQDAKLLKITVEPNLPMAEFFTQISKSSGMPVVVRWKQLDAIGACAAVPPDVDIQEAPLREAFDLINEALGMQHDGLDFRIADNRLTIATISYFDKNETVLVAYDLQQQAQDRARQLESKSLAEATRRVTEEVSHVIQELVQKDLWVDNGGDRASIAVYGSKLFVRAPKRFHPEIEWVISQLPITQDLAEVPLITGANLVLIRPEIVEPDMLDPSKIIDPVKVVIPTLPMEASPKK